MGRVTEKVFYSSIASKLKKSEKMVDTYMKAIIEQLFKEMNRGNSVTIKRFATFEPTLVGGCEMLVCGEKKYVEPRLTINFTLTKAGIQIMNNMILDKDTKERIKNNKKLMPYEKEIIGEPIQEKKDLREIFDKIVSEMKDRNLKEESDDDDENERLEYYEEDEICR